LFFCLKVSFEQDVIISKKNGQSAAAVDGRVPRAAGSLQDNTRRGCKAVAGEQCETLHAELLIVTADKQVTLTH
jgi:hypothetical protein